MPRFLIRASYTSDGAKGLLKEGGSKRRSTIAELVSAAGGRMESFYFAFGDTDAYVIVDGIDNPTAAAIALTVNGSGAATAHTTVLLTPEELDEASRKTVNYRPPGR